MSAPIPFTDNFECWMVLHPRKTCTLSTFSAHWGFITHTLSTLSAHLYLLGLTFKHFRFMHRNCVRNLLWPLCELFSEKWEIVHNSMHKIVCFQTNMFLWNFWQFLQVRSREILHIPLTCWRRFCRMQGRLQDCPEEGANLFVDQFSRKLHENERKLDREGGGVSKILLCKSAIRVYTVFGPFYCIQSKLMDDKLPWKFEKSEPFIYIYHSLIIVATRKIWRAEFYHLPDGIIWFLNIGEFSSFEVFLSEPRICSFVDTLLFSEVNHSEAVHWHPVLLSLFSVNLVLFNSERGTIENALIFFNANTTIEVSLHFPLWINLKFVHFSS